MNSQEWNIIHLDRSWFKLDAIPGMESFKEKLLNYKEEKITDEVSIFVKLR